VASARLVAGIQALQEIASQAPPRDEDWETGITTASGSDVYFAASMNDSGSVLGQHCDRLNGATPTCGWIMAVATICQPDAVGHILVNSSVGSHYLRTQCLDEVNGRYAVTLLTSPSWRKSSGAARARSASQ
jgi:hypothetical protein